MKCFYHNDLDGRCAGAIVAQYEKNFNKEDFFEVDYVQELPINKVSEGEKVYFVDYSFKDNTRYILDTLMGMGCNVIWIDHHTSSLNLIKDYEYLNSVKGIRQDRISGAGLTYMYLHKCEFDKIPYYIKLVSDYDCWQFKYDTDTTNFKIGIETRHYDALDRIWDDLLDESVDVEGYTTALYNLTNLIKTGSIIKNYIDKDNEQYRNSYAYESEIDGHKCLVVNKKSNSWIFGEKINEYSLVMIWVFNGNKYSYSIFSTSDTVDCSKIAEKFGGGGHKGAAGFSSDELLFKRA